MRLAFALLFDMAVASFGFEGVISDLFSAIGVHWPWQRQENAFLAQLHGSERSLTLRQQAEAEGGDRDKINRRWQALEREEWHGLCEEVKRPLTGCDASTTLEA